MEVLVFKTDIRDRKRISEIEPHLESIKGIVRWNVDLQDRDHILRIETDTISPRIIEQQLQQAGYYCEELED
jgi:hypothetical protein